MMGENLELRENHDTVVRTSYALKKDTTLRAAATASIWQFWLRSRVRSSGFFVMIVSCRISTTACSVMLPSVPLITHSPPTAPHTLTLAGATRWTGLRRGAGRRYRVLCQSSPFNTSVSSKGVWLPSSLSSSPISLHTPLFWIGHFLASPSLDATAHTLGQKQNSESRM